MKRALIVLVALFVLGGCTSAANESKRLEVVASISPLFDVLGGVGGRQVHAVNLAPLDPYGPLNARREQQLRDADFAVILGGGTQPEIERIASQRDRPTLTIIDKITGAGIDNHNVWLDPRNMMVVAQLVHAGLDEIRPGDTESIERSYGRFHRMLNDVDRINERTIASCKHKIVPVERPDFDFYTTRFGLRQTTIAELGQSNDRRTVFWSRLPDLETAQRYLDVDDLRSATLDTMEVRTDQARRGGATYGSLTALNLDALREGLDCEEVELGDK